MNHKKALGQPVTSKHSNFKIIIYIKKWS